MANVVKCTVCSSYYNGAVYESCPYCSKGKAKPVTAEQPQTEEKKAKKMPFFSSRKQTENKPSSENDTLVSSGSITAEQYKKTEMLMPEENGESVVAAESVAENRPFIPQEVNPQAEVSKQPTVNNTSTVPEPAPAYSTGSLSSAISKSGRTVGKYISNSTGESIAPVVGWLIGVKGGDYGRPYNLKSGRNKIGRSSDMDVCLIEESVSRSSVAVIAFDSKQREFSLLPGESDSLCYVNGGALYERYILKSGDELEFGDSELNKYIFVPLCSDSFNWDMYPQSKDET